MVNYTVNLTNDFTANGLIFKNISVFHDVVN